MRENGHAIVRKQFIDDEGYEKEMSVYEILDGSTVAHPRVLKGYADNCMYFEYLDAPTVCDLLEQAEAGQIDELVVRTAYEKMVDWLLAFNRLTHLSMGDVNARNFLFDGHTLYGIDFESTCAVGPLEVDIGQALAFLMSYYPEDSLIKHRLYDSTSHYATTRHHLDQARIEDSYIRERQILTDRRQHLKKGRTSTGNENPLGGIQGGKAGINC
ncbi:MAG: hypothetical protein FWD41_01110 [Actinomycetia bacterium]|nr:hypothetical protein [Actinomycetes bacterium]